MTFNDGSGIKGHLGVESYIIGFNIIILSFLDRKNFNERVSLNESKKNLRLELL